MSSPHPRRHLATTIAAASVAVAAAALTMPAASASAGQDHLTRGQRLSVGQQLTTITSAGAHTWLVMQSDGNLVLYTSGIPFGPQHACWASNTVHNGSYATYQSDGNFVVYNAAGGPTWASGTQNDGGTTVNLNRYGQLWAGRKAVSSFCD